MAAQSALTIDSREFDEATKRFVAGIKRLPTTKKSPLVRTAQRYRVFLQKAWSSRPTVAESAAWLGQMWRGLEPAYIRKSTGQAIPVWGGVKRMRKGRVTRVRTGPDGASSGIRQGFGTTKGEREAGYGSIELGQVFGGRNVKGKLKRDGSRYKRTDKQLGKGKGGSMLQSGMKTPFEFSDNNRSLAVVWTADHAAVHQEGSRERNIPARPFMWNPNIERHVTAIMIEELRAYAVALWQNRRGGR